MKLTKLLEGLSYECLQGTIDKEINNVVNDSRKVSEDDLFICIAGAVSDGHNFAKEVVNKGASVLLVEREVEVDEGVTVIQVENTRYAMALISASYFGHPDRKLKTIGVTGTKGKTTTTYMIRSMLEAAGHKVGVIGTIEVVIGEEHIPVNNTTPESYDIHRFFDRMVKEGCDAVVMEVSSQGLKLDRTAGIQFDYGLFTNLSPDHIGPNEHESFEEYLYCKSLLFKQCIQGIANRDDEHYEEITKDALCPVETFGLHENADLRASEIELTRKTDYLGVDFKMSGLLDYEVHVGVPGSFSVYNALGAIAVVRHFGVEEETVNQVLSNLKVKGRVQIVPTGSDYTLIIDYAHNAVALESILKTLRAYQPPRLVCMFGCGGNRAKSRRFEMGEVSGKMADFTVITSDNPRYEEPQAIIDDIITGIEKTDGEYMEIIDRKEAIAYCMTNARPGDIVVLAGKGHETYQEIKGNKYHMNEEEIVLELLGAEE
ncbi:MAG: UDP-N-acetylmuramoyl-L-alanyl-D-glutamate--2,6-diaminopimelate ligase [Lachnospiraceae bacterium]|nr:UDP-N-acetylmuramoyl-L-alanyl-D-glutamate--2,6-diaminopimelate ligase [Lachnospiraceae bacterium]